jgi:hypothetical protein
MNIDDKIRERIIKIQQLANRGFDGEKDAADIALKKLLKKYNISPSQVEEITKKQYFFKYATELDIKLFLQLLTYFFKDQNFEIYKHTAGKREISLRLQYLDYITISCSYEYFKRHMSHEWKKFSSNEIKRKRKIKTKNKLRADLQKVFYDQYIIRSGIFHPEQVYQLDVSEFSPAHHAYYDKIDKIKGGTYHKQVEKERLKIDYSHAEEKKIAPY